MCEKCLSPGGQTKEDTRLTSHSLTKRFMYIDSVGYLNIYLLAELICILGKQCIMRILWHSRVKFESNDEVHIPELQADQGGVTFLRDQFDQAA